MENEFKLNVREIQFVDIELISDYWINSDSEFLVNMGVDIDKLPTRSILRKQIEEAIKDKKSYALIWELDGKQIGHSNVNNIEYGKEATMHLHLWKSKDRKKGIGIELVKKSIPFYFENLKLEKIVCEPYALNPAPNRTLKKLGFELIKTYTTIPGYINFEQEVNRWELIKSMYDNRYALDK